MASRVLACTEPGRASSTSRSPRRGARRSAAGPFLATVGSGISGRRSPTVGATISNADIARPRRPRLLLKTQNKAVAVRARWVETVLSLPAGLPRDAGQGQQEAAK